MGEALRRCRSTQDCVGAWENHGPVLRFGLDFGTSNSALAVRVDGRAQVLSLDPLAGTVMPTMLYVRRDGSALVGQAAIDGYLSDNTTRGPIRRRFKLLDIFVPSTD